jgi:CheY-like chemotaxis protein
MSRTRHVLIIDDEIVPGQTEPEGDPMWYYAEALREQAFQVTEVTSTDEALRRLAEAPGAFTLIVLDIMMPPGQVLAAADTEEGMRTGIVLLGKIREICPDTPVAVLTQLRRPSLLNQLRGKPNCFVFLKPDYTPFAFVEGLTRILGD